MMSDCINMNLMCEGCTTSKKYGGEIQMQPSSWSPLPLLDTWEQSYKCVVGRTFVVDKNCIIDVKVINEKIVLVKFVDNKEYKQVCKEEYDTFSLERALYLAIAKHNDPNKELTSEGIEHAAGELKYQKKYVKIVKDGLKLYENKLKEEQKEKERAELIERKRVKRHQKKTERAARKREEQINIQKEAYIRAMKVYDETKEHN